MIFRSVQKVLFFKSLCNPLILDIPQRERERGGSERLRLERLWSFRLGGRGLEASETGKQNKNIPNNMLLSVSFRTMYIFLKEKKTWYSYYGKFNVYFYYLHIFIYFSKIINKYSIFRVSNNYFYHNEHNLIDYDCYLNLFLSVLQNTLTNKLRNIDVLLNSWTVFPIKQHSISTVKKFSLAVKKVVFPNKKNSFWLTHY